MDNSSVRSLSVAHDKMADIIVHEFSATKASTSGNVIEDNLKSEENLPETKNGAEPMVKVSEVQYEIETIDSSNSSTHNDTSDPRTVKFEDFDMTWAFNDEFENLNRYQRPTPTCKNYCCVFLMVFVVLFLAAAAAILFYFAMKLFF